MQRRQMMGAHFFFILVLCVIKLEVSMAKRLACVYPYASQVGLQPHKPSPMIIRLLLI